MVTEAGKKNHITVNGQIAKPLKEVFRPTESLSGKTKSRKSSPFWISRRIGWGVNWSTCYRKNETPAEAYQHLELLKLSKEHYRKNGTGRPTKKDRRDIDDFGNEIGDEEHEQE